MKKQKIEVSKSAMVSAWFKKFPWLGNHMNRAAFDKVISLPVTLDVLRKDCGYCRTSDGHYLSNMILLFSKDGKLLGEVGKIPTTEISRRWFLFGPKTPYKYEKMSHETIGQALNRLNGQGVQFIISSLNKSRDLMITAPPEGKTIEEALADELKMASQIVEEEFAEVTKAQATVIV